MFYFFQLRKMKSTVESVIQTISKKKECGEKQMRIANYYLYRILIFPFLDSFYLTPGFSPGNSWWGCADPFSKS